MPLCLVAKFGSESDDIVVKEVLFKGEMIMDLKGIEGGGFTWELNNKYYSCRYCLDIGCVSLYKREIDRKGYIHI